MTNLEEHWASWAEVSKVLHKKYQDWLNSPNRTYHCIYCGDHGTLSHFTHILPEAFPSKITHKVVGCERCKEYKGVEPCIEDYCTCWQLDLLRKMKEREVTNVDF